MVRIVSFVAGLLVVLIAYLLPGPVEPAVVMAGIVLLTAHMYMAPDTVPESSAGLIDYVEREVLAQENVRVPWEPEPDKINIRVTPLEPVVTRDTDLRVIAKLECPIERQVKRDLERLNA